MVTFSDCMTLLLTFFVLLLSFSAFDDSIFAKLRVIYSRGLNSITPLRLSESETFLYMLDLTRSNDLEKGSEKPTLDRGTEDQSKQDTEPPDFHTRKVFLISSERVFVGKGTLLTMDGRRLLSEMGDFIAEVQPRVVISENGPAGGGDLGLRRAWAILDYFANKKKLDTECFSIAAESTAPHITMQGRRNQQDHRKLEIVFLERNLYR